MARKVLPSYTIIRDTREKPGYGFFWEKNMNPKRRPPICDGTITQTLKTGDYSLVGYEDILCIERKEDYAELWGNYAERDRFQDEMERMSTIKHKMVIIETQLTKDIFGLSPPQYKTSVPGRAMTRWLMSLTAKYGVPFIPAGACGKYMAQQFMEEIVRVEKDRWVEQSE
ncbi:hypothetical protein LCGC14_1422630 [marine sediment metagenome]|uniref:ERCC4 domain-containing protein n=1 Tax=marine sediment metagenome TaxID=412755 RepID=A0A0F9M6D8_9ZZZZ